MGLAGILILMKSLTSKTFTSQSTSVLVFELELQRACKTHSNLISFPRLVSIKLYAPLSPLPAIIPTVGSDQAGGVKTISPSHTVGLSDILNFNIWFHTARLQQNVKFLSLCPECCIPQWTIVGEVNVNIYHGLQVGRKLVEFVDGSNIDPAGVLVHHQAVELWPLLLAESLHVFILVHYVSPVRH